MNFGGNWDDWMAKMVQEDAEKIMDVYYENGGNFIDTGTLYSVDDSEFRKHAIIKMVKANNGLETGQRREETEMK